MRNDERLLLLLSNSAVGLARWARANPLMAGGLVSLALSAFLLSAAVKQ